MANASRASSSLPRVGERVCARDNPAECGTVRYVGRIHSKPAHVTWIGVEWDEHTSRGSHDGVVDGEAAMMDSLGQVRGSV